MHIYGKRLKEYRERNKLTQNDMSRLLELKQGNYSRLEKGTQDIKLSMILNLCEKLNLSADWLLGIGEREEGKLTILSTASAAISNPTKDEGKIPEGIFITKQD